MATTDVSLPMPKSLSMMSSDSSEKVLSRKRRFFIPQTSGWLLKWVYLQMIDHCKMKVMGDLFTSFPLISLCDLEANADL